MKLNFGNLYLESIEKTCECCPSQFHIIVNDGCGNILSIYARYRWGVLTAKISNGNVDDMDIIKSGLKIYEECIGDKYDGYMLTSEVIKYLNLQ